MNKIEVTNVSIKRIKSPTSKIIAFVDITLSSSLVIRGLKLIKGTRGLFVAFPSQKRDDKYYDIVFPINRETREHILEEIMKEYETNMAESNYEAEDSPNDDTDDFFK